MDNSTEKDKIEYVGKVSGLAAYKKKHAEPELCSHTMVREACIRLAYELLGGRRELAGRL
jgi:hypothetical protein